MMRDDKLIELFEFYAKGETYRANLPAVEPMKLASTDYKEVWQFDKLRDYEDVRRHAAWMATQAIGFLKEAQASDVEHLSMTTRAAITRSSKREKAMRWLGFIQATLWLCSAFTLDELKEHSHRCSDDYEATK